MGYFAERLVKLRNEAGFPTAYRFYHRNGGRRTFPFTYVHYLHIDRGKTLPRPQWLPTFLTCLRLAPGGSSCRELFLSYLRDLLKTSEAFDLVMGSVLSRAASVLDSPSREALRWMKTQHAVHLTVEQFRAASSDETTYWCFEILLNDNNSWTAQELAQLLEVPLPAVRRALRRLTEHRIVRAMPGDSYRNRNPGKFFTFPKGGSQQMLLPLQRAWGYWDRMHERRGTELSRRRELVRAEEAAMRSYLHVLSETVDCANMFSTFAKGENTGLFAVEVAVRKVMPF